MGCAERSSDRTIRAEGHGRRIRAWQQRRPGSARPPGSGALTAVALAGEATTIVNRATFSDPTDAIGLGFIFALTYGVCGALILSRQPANPIGRIFLYLTAVMAVSQLCSEYAIYAYVTTKSGAPLREIAAWLSQWTFFLAFPVGPTLLFLFFPDGLDDGRKWRAVLVLALLGSAVLTFGFLAASGPINPATRGNGGFFIPHNNPTGLLGPGDNGDASSVQGVGWLLSGLALIASVVAAILRLRRASGERRQQLKWLSYFAAPVAPGFAIHFVIRSANLPVPDVVQPIYILIFIFGIPLSTAIAILKYRLYGIDVVISRAIVYGALAGFITVAYVGIVVGVGALVGSGGRPNIALSILATAVVAVGFQPLRERLQRLANRVVYGKRATPYEVLSEFSERVAESYAADDVLPRMARVLAEGSGAEQAQVWLRSGGALRPAASYPASSTESDPLLLTGQLFPEIPGVARAVPVRHQGELLGARYRCESARASH